MTSRLSPSVPHKDAARSASAATSGAAFDVAVRGRGIVARTLALLLARQGLRVALVQGAGAVDAQGRPDVRAYALNVASISLLRELRVWDTLPPDACTPVYDMTIRGDAGGAVLRFSAWQQGVDSLASIVDAAALEEGLATAVAYCPGLALTTDAPEAALEAICEGRDSSQRERRGVTWHHESHGQTAIAARLLSDSPHAGTAHQWFRSPDVLALLPFDRPQVRHGFGLVWSLPSAEAQRWLAADVQTFEAGLNEATKGEAGVLRLAGERASWPLARAHAEPVCGPGWVLLGDAAHVVHPLAGQGLNLGLGDAASLARVLADREPWRPLGDVRLLQRHVRTRLEPLREMDLLTTGLLQLFARGEPGLKSLRNRGLAALDTLVPLKRWLVGRALEGRAAPSAMPPAAPFATPLDF